MHGANVASSQASQVKLLDTHAFVDEKFYLYKCLFEEMHYRFTYMELSSIYNLL